MPRDYKCRKCGNVHGPPTGKHCRQQEPANEPSSSLSEELLSVLTDIKEQMNNLTRNDTAHAGGSQTYDSPGGSPSGGAMGTASPEEQFADTDLTPITLRQNVSAMDRAANRLARIRLLDDEADDKEETNKTKKGGKKSGSMLIASETVEERIDWPHLYVTRMVGGRRKGVAYTELTAPEFAFGFISMIESPHCKWDYRTMNRLLRTIMKMATESWPNARALYEEIGIDVEKDLMDWGDTEQIREMRFAQAQNPTTEKKEIRDTGRAPLRQAPQGTRSCTAYQTGTCEQTADHTPFTHACGYCLRVCAAVCRHPESDCIRKVTDAAKNGRKREQ